MDDRLSSGKAERGREGERLIIGIAAVYAMKHKKKVVLSQTGFTCPVTGKWCRVGATVILQPDDIMQRTIGPEGEHDG